MKENVIIYEMKSLRVAEGAGIQGDVMINVWETIFYDVLCKEKWKIWNKISFSLKKDASSAIELNEMALFRFFFFFALSFISSFPPLPGEQHTST